MIKIPSRLYILIFFLSFFPIFFYGGLRLVHIFTLIFVFIYCITTYEVRNKRLLLLFVYPISILVSIVINKSYENLLLVFDLFVLTLFVQTWSLQYTYKQYYQLIRFSSAVLSVLLISISLYHVFILGSFYQYKSITGIKALFGLSPLFYLLSRIDSEGRNSLSGFITPLKSQNLVFYLLCFLTILSGERKAILSSFLSISTFFLVTRLNKWGSISLKINLELQKRLLLIVKKVLWSIVLGVLALYLFLSTSNIHEFFLNMADSLKNSQFYSLSNYSRVLQLSYVFKFFNSVFLWGSPSSFDINSVMEADYSAAVASPLHNYYLRILIQFGYFAFSSIFLVYALASNSVAAGIKSSLFLKLKIAVVYSVLVYCFTINIFIGGGSLSTLLVFFPLFFALVSEKSR